MFQFALYVSTIREIVRPGVMWFIRDPNDPQFHPMTDIIERPVALQLRKLFVGIFMYASMVIGGVGGFVAAVKCSDLTWNHFYGIGGVAQMWPLKWEFS